MKKIYAIIVSVSILIIFILCFLAKNQGVGDFFIWMDGYVATEKGSTTTIAFTQYFPKSKPPFEIKDVTSIYLYDNKNFIQTKTFSCRMLDNKNDTQFDGYVYEIQFYASSLGVSTCNKLIINLKNNTEKIYPIGSWTFDVFENETPDLVDVWDSPYATSSNNIFLYDYKPLNNAVIDSIKYGNKSEISGSKNISKNRIAVTANAPIQYIKTKITIKKDDNLFVAYGKGCYCGALNIDDTDIDASKKYYNDNK